MLFRVLWPLTVIVFLSRAQAMPPSAYLESLRQNSLMLKEAQELRKKAQSQFELTNRFWSLEAGVQSGPLETRLDYSGHYRQSGVQTTASLSQTTPVGLSATLSGSFLDDPDRKNSQSLSLDLNQSLWRNAFGLGDRAERRAAIKTLEAEMLLAKLKAFEACGLGYDIYFKAWAAQEKLRYLQESLLMSEKSFTITRNNYRRKMVRRLDFESAESDYLAAQDRLTEAEQEWEYARSEFVRYLPVEKFPAGKISYEFQPVDLAKNSEVSLLSQVEKLRAEALEELRVKEKSFSRSDVSLFASVDYSVDPSLTGTTLTDTETYWTGLKMDFPWFNPVPEARYKKVLAESLVAEHKWRRVNREQTNLLEKAKRVLAQTTQKLKRQKKRLELRRSQIRQARKYLNSGKMEYEDYLRYRNAELEEQLKGLNLVKLYWQARMEILQLSGEGSEVLCKGFWDAPSN